MRSPSMLRRLWRFVRHDREAADLEEEMRLHLALRAESLERDGRSAADARTEARRQFGNVTQLAERSHDAWGFASLDRLRQDLRFALRRLRQTPSLSVPIVLVLALGIGATTAVFSAVDAALLRPLPFARPHELVTLTSVSVPFQASEGKSRLIGIDDVWAMPQLFSAAAAFASGGLNLEDAENPRRVNAGVVTQTFFATLGVRPAQGRAFTPEEGRPGGGRVVILSDALWRSQFGSKDVIGTTLRLNGNAYLVAGVMAPGFAFPRESDLWIPLSVPATGETFAPFRGFLPSLVVARLAPGVSREFAASQLLARWEQRLVGSDPRSSLKEWVDDVRQKGAALPLQQELAGDRRQALVILMGATVLLLLIACANVANLLLTDASRRQREIALRQVLGATARRIVRQLVTESVLLSLAGAALGLAIAPAVLSLLRVLLPADLAAVAPARLDLRVLAFATSVAVITGIGFGLWPALGAARTDASETIKGGGGHGATAGGTGRARRMLVGAELALTVMLLVGAGLMLRSLQRVLSLDTGMQTQSVATMELTLARQHTRAERLRVVEAILDRLGEAPGIDAAGAVNDLPLRGGGGMSVTIQIDGTAPAQSVDDMQWARWLIASPGYFRAMGINLLRGRSFTPADDSLAPPVAVISEEMARTYWKDEDPVGRTFYFTGPAAPPVTVVGVVADVRESKLESDPQPQMYFPLAGNTPPNVAVVARSSLAPAALLGRMRDAVHSAAPDQAVYNLRMMDDVVSTALAPRRTNTMLIALFAGLALVLAALGVYAVVAYGVAQRSREFGIRSALGATASNLLGLVSAEMLVVAAIGIAIGLAGAWAVSRVLASLLYQVDAHDAVTFAVVPLLLLLPAALATLVPAWRATRVNLNEVMRAD